MRNRMVAAAALVLAMATPAYALGTSELTQADVDRALEARNEAAQSLTALTGQFEEAVALEEAAVQQIADIARAIARLELDIADKRVEVLELVRNRYMSGGPAGTERLFAATTFDEIPVQSEYFDLLSARDQSTLRGLEVAEELHRDQQSLLDETLEAQRARVAEITKLRDEILTTLTNADAEYNSIAAAYAAQEERKRIEEEERLRAEAERAAAAAAAALAAATSTTTTVGSSPTTTVTTTTTPVTTTRPPATTVPSTTHTTSPPPPPPPSSRTGKHVRSTQPRASRTVGEHRVQVAEHTRVLT